MDREIDMKTTSYGQKGGEGPTRGRKAETIQATIGGQVYRKRVFFGQRALALCAREDGTECLTAWADEATGRAHISRVSSDDWPVQIVAKANITPRSERANARIAASLNIHKREGSDV
jgi:hypothetical protein